jgi:uncharacterized membrane protein
MTHVARALLAAPLATRVHAFAAMAAFALGAAQLAAPKGTVPHRTIGWIWVLLMVTVAMTSFWIHDLRGLGRVEPNPSAVDLHADHAPGAVIHAVRHRVEDHRKAMLGIFTGALVIAGLFTFWPGRIMHAVVFGIEDAGRPGIRESGSGPRGGQAPAS